MTRAEMAPAMANKDPDWGGCPTDGSGVPVDVTCVEAPACHLCGDAKSTLAVLAQTYPMTIHVLSIDSVEGAALMARHPCPDESAGSAERAVLQLRAAAPEQARTAPERSASR